ncbi:uncharacterized protein LOC118194027 isoform X2 [Stegodyphus dumicola]|uniref:uncharacterized protein LOC118194027 isoform X2 n=1 Tax=Stegodyphus dumicola TaxID=202533 RepID=UPI0015AFA04B|nr:uncharacterized protein LOC118194027 isoform X2 [Stegodyphus dumicola]
MPGRALLAFACPTQWSEPMRSLRSSFADDSSSTEISCFADDNKMASSTVRSSSDTTSGFRESLRFFQSQVDKVNVHHVTTSTPASRKSQLLNGHNKTHVSTEIGIQSKANPRTAVPSVDNILNNVKSICASRNSKTFESTTSRISSVHRSSSSSEIYNKITPVTFQTSDDQPQKLCEGVTRSEQITTKHKTAVSDHSKSQSLLRNFNPVFGTEENVEKERPSNLHDSTHSNSTHSKTNIGSSKIERSSAEVDSAANALQHSLSLTKLSSPSCLKTVSDADAISKQKDLDKSVEKVAEMNKDETVNIQTNRTFGQCKEKLSKMELNKTLNLKNDSISSDSKLDSALDDGIIVKECDEGSFEKQSDSFESDYDSQDFVVHKATFPEDYLEAMSEDNYSSVNEDYEVEHPDEQTHGPVTPSPDYGSDEEEYQVQHGDVPQYEDVEFIDNSAQYLSDPRRYAYYPDELELEVIPEEDENDIEDDDYDMYSHEVPHKKGSFQVSNQSSDDSRCNNHGECDSGLTDDQRSSSSTTEECDLEDDTDSAKGSLPLQDSSSESPTYNERANMFQNVEYHKKPQKKKHFNKKIVDDYKISTQNGKSIEIISNIDQIAVDVDQIGEDTRQTRSTTGTWDPHELIKVLYRLDFPNEPFKTQTRYINKEGYLEKLPSGRKKATYWNPWKTKYIKLKDGFLYCFDNIRSEKPTTTLQLMGGHIDSLESNMLGIDDQKGHYVVLKCPNEEETASWKNALHSHCAEDFVNAYTSPCLHPLPINQDVIIIDFGSCSVRAGILMSSPTLPQLFFPAVCATSRTGQKKMFGAEALKPSNRKDCQLSFPLRPSGKVAKYSIDVSILPDLLKHVFQELNVSPENFKIQLSIPRNLSLQTKLKVARMLLDDFKVKGINITHQAILSLHAYNSKSGIIVDIGDRLDVIPIIEGYIIESGVTRLPYGGQRMIHHLKHVLAEKNISLVSDVESYLARYILEQLCYVADDYNEELQRYHTNPEDFEMSISTSHFFKEDCPWDEIVLDMGRFHVPEGLFTPERWGLDNPGLHKLVHNAIQECGVDLRREMTRSIFISGGLTLLPGFVERLEKEIDKLTPDTISPKVHASPYRYHMSYIGACKIALGEKFDDICITKQMWKKEGNTCVKKWHI